MENRMNPTEFQEKHIWRVLSSYFQQNTVVDNHIQSYDDFATFGMQRIIDQDPVIAVPNYTVRFGKICLAPPQVIEEDRTLKPLYPNDARMRDLDYDSAICCDITETFVEGNEKEEKHHYRVVLGRIPVMLNSSICNLKKLSSSERIAKGECSKDSGGYFIINGNERVLVAQMRNAYNQVMVLKHKNQEKYRLMAEVRSMSDETGHSVLVQAMLGTDDRKLQFSIPYIKEPIPIGIIFKSLGYIEDREIINLIGLDSEKSAKYLRYILRDCFFCKTQPEALAYLGKFSLNPISSGKEVDYARQIIDTEMLPHIGITGTAKEKACFLGRMVKKLISTAIGDRDEDVRDSYIHKRVEVSGTLIYDIFRNLYKKFRDNIMVQLEKRKRRPDIISMISRIKLITHSIRQCFSTGNWNVQKNSAYVREGVSQPLDRMTYAATLSHLRRIIIPLGRKGKNTLARKLQQSSFGYICPCECFDPATPILTWGGEIKRADQVKVGDFLVDDKGLPTRVKSTCSGWNEMYRISHSSGNFADYTVTDNHILTLKSACHKKIEFDTTRMGYSVQFLNKDTITYEKRFFQNYLSATQAITMDKSDGIVDISIERYLSLPEEIKKTFRSFKSDVKWPEREIKLDPFEYGKSLTPNDSIDLQYLVNSKTIRTQVLRGLHTNKLYSGSRLFQDMVFLMNSLGYGDTTSSFTLQPRPKSPFVGWQLEGSGRFLLGDCTVTHNTPEGQKIGLVLNYSIMTKFTRKIPKVDVKRALEKCKTITDVEDEKDTEKTAIFLNGSVIGFAKDADDTLKELRMLRKKGFLDKEISISYDVVDDELHIFCDEGRLTRPLLALKNNKLKISPQNNYDWSSLIKDGIIEYVDASEIENAVIAMDTGKLAIQQNDYCEIHPSTILGVMAGMIPFPDHSQSPRNCYQSSMGKQALGIPVLSYNLRADTLLHVMQYPQRPLTTTKLAEMLGMNDMPSGVNAIVAIACYSGWNQEDSVMLNLSSAQRGLFRLTSYHTIDTVERKRDAYTSEVICVPPRNSDPSIKEGEPGYFKRKNANYSLLDENGIVKPRIQSEACYVSKNSEKRFYSYNPATVVKKGDVLIGKVITTSNKNGEETKLDDSIVVQPGEEGTVDRVFITTTPNGYKLVKIVIRVTREPTLGDKLASRAAQKGTIGMIYSQENMPFNSQGIQPDIIINPCCIPSRMTINQLIECVLGKECTMSGEYGDVTPFTENSVNVADKIVGKISSRIKDYGFQSQGYETLYNGMTGEQIKAQIFMGPTYYQRLKHMVDDKLHARARGHVTMLTRQPLEGRARDGGHRFGEMERDCTISHGGTAFLRERLFEVSDPFQIPVCKKCKIVASSDICQSCNDKQVVLCNFPYASKLLHQELTSMQLKILIHPEEK